MTSTEIPKEIKDSAPLPTKKEVRERRAELSREILAEINDGSSVPLSKAEAELVEKRAKKKTTMEDVIRDFGSIKWSSALKKLFVVIFGGGKNAVEGAGYFAKNIENIPLVQRSGLIAQIERKDKKEIPLSDRVISSVLRCSLEQSLSREGFVASRRAMPSGEPMVIENGHADLQYYVLKRNGEKKGKTILEEVVPDQGKPRILGALNYRGQLPAGTFLFFDSEGYPLFIAPENDPGFRPNGIQLYRRDERKESQRQSLKQKEAIEFLSEHVEPGDILLVSQGGKDETAVHEAFENIQRSLAKTDFHATHAMIVNEEKKLFHVNWKGKGSGSAEKLLQGYNGVTVVRLRQGEEERKVFARTAFKRYQEVQGFNMGGLVKQGIAVATKWMKPKTSEKDACICTDFVKDTAASMRIEKLAQCQTPAEIGACPDVELVYSLDLGKE